MQVGSGISLSPSYNSYSNTKIAEIAARVAGEFPAEEFDDEFYFGREEDASASAEEEKTECVDEDLDESKEEFEFAFAIRDSELSSPISADEIFQNGRIRAVCPVFDHDLLQKNGVGKGSMGSGESPAIRLPLRKLFIEERETTATATTMKANRTSSFSSSEAGDLDGVPADTYCVWRPKEAAAAEQWKKSSSTGANSKRWKFKDMLLKRSHSEGRKDSFVFVSASNGGKKKENGERVKATPRAVAGKVKAAAAPPPRRSYLPYKQDLVGFFGNVNGLSKNLHPF